MQHTRVAVLRGGPSSEYSVSLQTGAAVLEALRECGIPCVDVVITKQGVWLEQGRRRDPERLLDAIDVVFIALHGTYGEDGRVQRLLQRKGVPFVGSRALASSVAFNKELTKHTLKPHGIRMPRHRRMRRDELVTLPDDLTHLANEVGEELFAKPLASGSSIGAQYISREADLTATLQELFQEYDDVLLEEYIAGREATVGVIDNFRGQRNYALPVVEIIPPHDARFYDATNKYDGSTEHVCPANFTAAEKQELTDIALRVHEHIGCRHVSRSDFLVRDGEVYFLEVNTLPGLTPHSNLPYAAAAVGLSFPDLILHLIEHAHLD